MVNERELAVIKALTEAKGPSGFEDEAVAAARESLSDICDFEEDSLRNLYIYRRANTGNKPVLMLDAHSDEVGFIVHSIKPNGTLRFLELGGWSKNTLPGTRVLVRNKDGEWIRGAIAAKPPHFLSDEERAQNKVQSVSNLVIDIGARSAEEAKEAFGIRIGEPAVPATPFEYDGSRRARLQGCREQGKAEYCNSLRRLPRGRYIRRSLRHADHYEKRPHAPLHGQIRYMQPPLPAFRA